MIAPGGHDMNESMRLAQSAWAEIKTTHADGELAIRIIADRIQMAVEREMSRYGNEGTTTKEVGWWNLNAWLRCWAG